MFGSSIPAFIFSPPVSLTLPSPHVPPLLRAPAFSPSISRRVRHTPMGGIATPTDLECAVLTSLKPLQTTVGVNKVHKYKKTLPDAFATALQAVSQLEKLSGGFGMAKLRAQLIGRWRLIMTDSIAVEKNGGSITGLGSLPGAKCLWVDVVLGADGSAKTVEGIEVFGGLMNGENELVGKWKVGGKGGRVLEVTYEKAVLMGKGGIRAESKALLAMSYVGEKVRVGRSGKGEVYVFERTG